MTEEEKDKQGTEEEVTPFKKWYEKNKEELARKRRQKYQDDPDYKEQKKKEATRHYWLKQRRAKSLSRDQISLEDLDMKPSGTVTVTIGNANDIRYGEQYEVPVYMPSDVAKVLKRSTQTLRLWLLNGLLEDVFIRNARNYRVFTQDQMRIFAENRHWLSFSVQDFEKHPFFARVNEEMTRLLPDGLEPMHEDTWRTDPSPCPFCGRPESLQHKINGDWTHVNCFGCRNPLDVVGRAATKQFRVTGECMYCNNLVDTEVEAVDEHHVNVGCDRCGRRLDDYVIDEIERGN